MSLRRLLRGYLGPYTKVLWVVMALQAVQTFASLTLPTLNASIINNGVLQGDTACIRRIGLIMAAFTLVQIAFAVGAGWFGAHASMGFGCDVRRDLFQRVLAFSAREVGQFGAPSLITRITNDVQQVQMLVVMTCTMMIAAPITMVIGVIMALREDLGLSVVLVVAMPAAVILLGSVVARMIPNVQRMQTNIDAVNAVLREQITGIRVVRAFGREPEETSRFAAANNDLTLTSL